MVADITERLQSLGYTVVEGDSWLLSFISDSVESRMILDCGVYDTTVKALVIPTEAHRITVDKICGEFLKSKKATGTIPGFDLTAAVKQIQEGDTSITYAIGSGDKTPRTAVR